MTGNPETKVPIGGDTEAEGSLCHATLHNRYLIFGRRLLLSSAVRARSRASRTTAA